MLFADQMAQLSTDQRLHFYEVLAHNLTVGMRGVWSNDALSDAEKIDRMKWVNELLHRVTAKVYVLRLKTHEWTEADFGEMIDGYMRSHPGIASTIEEAVRISYRSVANAEMA